jgi:hypothetical protein
MADEEQICRICRSAEAKLSYEHVPPRAAFNEDPTTVYGLADWLAREEDGTMSGGRIEQRGVGARTLCERCNNNTGSWYGNELALAARAGARILLEEVPLTEFDALTESRYGRVTIKQTDKHPHPLRLIKQIITMLLATSPPTLSLSHPDLGDFVLDRERRGLPDRYHFYLSLFAGPMARSTGVAERLDVERRRHDTLVEVAFPPFAYVMTIDSEPEAIESCDITEFVTVGYDQRANLELDLLIGFGHTPYPADYRTKAMVERDRELNKTAAAELGGEANADN